MTEAEMVEYLVRRLTPTGQQMRLWEAVPQFHLFKELLGEQQKREPERQQRYSSMGTNLEARFRRAHRKDHELENHLLNPYWNTGLAAAMVLGVLPSQHVADEDCSEDRINTLGTLRTALHQAARHNEINYESPPLDIFIWVLVNGGSMSPLVLIKVLDKECLRLGFAKQSVKNDQTHNRSAGTEGADIASGERSAWSRERNTLLKILIGVAKSKYGHRTDGMRSRAPGEMAADLDRQGISVTDETIRKYLSEAVEHLPPSAGE